MKIKEIKARKIFDSNGRDAVEIELTSDVRKATASIGSGTSVGKYEVVSYPEKIESVINLFNKEINTSLKGIQINTFDDLDKVERYVKGHDFSDNMKNIGGNALVALELAILKTISLDPMYTVLGERKITKMPMPLGNCIGGGKHSGGKGPDIQEFLILPKVKDFEAAADINIDVYYKVREELKKRDKNFLNVRNMEGGWQCSMSNLEIISMLNKIVDNVAKEYKADIKIGLDVAGNEIWNGRRYEYKNFSRVTPKKNLSKEEQIEFIRKLIKNNNLAYVEDPLHEDDFGGFEELNKDTEVICGDDLIATNPERIKLAENRISYVIIKPNQIGSLLKTKEVVMMAKKMKIMPVISHRSGETNDDSLAHLAVGWECPMIKTGIVGGERVSKINELLAINEYRKSI